MRGLGRACIVINPKSGKKRGRTDLGEIKRLIRERDLDVEIRPLSKGSDVDKVARKAVEDGFGTIIAAGGDGTISGVASALHGKDVRMGILPLGTFNYFARSLDIPDDIEGAIDVLAAGGERTIPVGTINGKVFLNNASLGIYPEVLRTRETTYTRWGRSRIAAYWSVLLTLMRLPKPLKLEITTAQETKLVRTPLAFVVSNAYQLDEVGLEGAECIRDGKMVLLIAPDSDRLKLVRHGLTLAMGLARKNRDFSMICVDELTIASDRKHLLVARDGERARMERPFRFELHKDSLRVITPEHAASKVR
ncbi:diacylglycerol kinase family protein [Sulfitobacter sp. LCG007]